MKFGRLSYPSSCHLADKNAAEKIGRLYFLCNRHFQKATTSSVEIIRTHIFSIRDSYLARVVNTLLFYKILRCLKYW